ncbi:hypothetical protein [Heliophilum fasciatum]|nr:hypothetical protein [Heliophilum fasciatum]MCW2278841.1 flagellar biosynthesis/type III secretory pathway protein FliH [Heliophilum fasciatum]
MTDIEKLLRGEGREVDRLEGFKESFKKGFIEGFKEGLREGKEMVAIAALKEGISPELVAEITGIPIDKIKKMASAHLPQ